MKRIWAPWRIGYLKDSTQKKRSPKKNTRESVKLGSCVFCEAFKNLSDKKSLVLHRGRHGFVIMNKYPYANGHIMVMPVRHTADFAGLTRAEHAEMGELLAVCHRILKQTMHCDGFNIGMNIGEVAGAGIAEHLHYHIVPRWAHDHNFMPTIAETRTIPEHMDLTCRKLKKRFLEN